MSGKATVAMARNFMRRVVAKYPDASSTTYLEDAGQPSEHVGRLQVFFSTDTVDKTLFLLSLGDGEAPQTHRSQDIHVNGRTKTGLPFTVLVPHDVWEEVKAALAGGALNRAFGVEART